MKTYIGTKIIEAVPAIRKGCKVYEKDQPIAMGMVPRQCMNFGLAIEAMKKGKKCRRAGWNGKNQHIELASAISYTSPAGTIVNAEHAAIGNKAIAFCGTSGVQMGWLASQADMLADDWEIVE